MRIAFITDTHVGAAAGDWGQQPRWVGGFPTLIRRLRRWVDEHDVDLVIHGGDVVHTGTFARIQTAAALLGALGRPVLVSLGNHDLTEPESLEAWQRIAADHHWMTLGDATVEFEDCDVVVMNNHWSSPTGEGLYWPTARPYREVITPGQVAWLDEALGRSAGKPVVVAMHSPVVPLPPELTGMDAMYKVPDPGYAAAVIGAVERSGRPAAVLGGHNHVTYAAAAGRWAAVSTASLTEVPFQFRVIEVAGERITVSTHTLGPGPVELVRDEARAWTAGRECDRNLKLGED